MTARVPAGVREGGRFATEARDEAAASLALPDVVHPRSFGELVTALGPQPDGAGTTERMVVIDAACAAGSSSEVEVHGPVDGSTLHVVHRAGSAPLRIVRGKVLIDAAARPWASSVTVQDGAQAEVLTAARSKISTHTEPGATLRLVLAPGVYGYQHVEPGGLLEAVGDRDACRITARTDMNPAPVARADGTLAGVCSLCGEPQVHDAQGWRHEGTGSRRCQARFANRDWSGEPPVH